MTRLIVGLTGKAGSGKDTAAEALVEHLSFHPVALADPIKRALNGAFGWSMVDWRDREWKETVLDEIGFSPRQLAQTLGTEWGRNLDPDFWVRVLSHHVTRLQIPRVVVTDVRFDNEAQWIQQQGGWVIEILRDGVEAVNKHSSEAGLNPRHVDFTIQNDYSIEILQRTIVQEIQDKLRANTAI